MFLLNKHCSCMFSLSVIMLLFGLVVKHINSFKSNECCLTEARNRIAPNCRILKYFVRHLNSYRV